MKFNIALIIVIVLLGFYTIKIIYNITKSIKNQEIETKYGKNRVKKVEEEVYDSIEADKYERVRKTKTYSKRRKIEINDEKYLMAKKYSKRIKITSLFGWVVVIIILIIYCIKNNIPFY